MAQQPIEPKADVVIIGGGIAGCALTYYLAKRGAKVVLVEKNGQVNFEQSSRNAGFVRQQGRHPYEIPMMMACNKLWQGLQQELNADFGWAVGGNLRLATNEKDLAHLEGLVKIEREMGLDVRLVSPAEVAKLLPPSEKRWAGGMYTPNDAQAEPAKVAPAFARAAQEHGAKVYTHCTAERVLRAGGAVTGVATERGEIKAPVVVCAGGAWSYKVARLAGLDLPQRVTRSSPCRTDPTAPVTKITVWGGNITFRQGDDNGFHVGGGATTDYDITLRSFQHLGMFLPMYLKNWQTIRLHVGTELLRDLGRSMPGSSGRKHPFAHTVDWEPAPNRRKVEQNFKNFTQWFPGIQGLRIVKTWAGNIDATPDAIPVLGVVPNPKGFVFLTGFSGHGFGLGPMAAKVISELILDGKPSFDLRHFRYSRFKEGDLAEARQMV
ncbi:MAG: FAD-binding oxidoreductase [Chloroflexi bacterium]|nr:FAD-binding oxidoreductase [Chloroflexota bacterium]